MIKELDYKSRTKVKTYIFSLDDLDYKRTSKTATLLQAQPSEESYKIHCNLRKVGAKVNNAKLHTNSRELTLNDRAH